MKQDAIVEAEVQLTREDLDSLWKYSPLKYMMWFLMFLALGCAYIAFAEFVNEGFTTSTAFVIIEYSLVGLMAFLVGFFGPRMRTGLMLRTDPTLRKARLYSLSGSGIRADSDLMTCNWQWGAFSSIVESRRAFLLYQSKFFSAVILPKRCFSTPADVIRLRELFRGQFKGQMKLLG